MRPAARAMQAQDTDLWNVSKYRIVIDLAPLTTALSFPVKLRNPLPWEPWRGRGVQAEEGVRTSHPPKGGARLAAPEGMEVS